MFDFLTELQRIESWEIFHSNSIGSPSILSKFLYSGELSHLCSSSSSPVLNARLSRRTQGRTPFHPSRIAGLGTARFMGPSASRNTFSESTITDGNTRIGELGAAAPFLPLRWPDCTSSRLRAEEYDRPVTQSIATPEPSSRTIPALDRTLVAG